MGNSDAESVMNDWELPQMKATITKTGKYFGYRWQVGNIYNFTVTKQGAISAARRYAREIKFNKWAEQEAEEIQL